MSSSLKDRLIFHFEFVDSLLLWMNKRSVEVSIDYLINLPASQFMQGIIIRNEKGEIPPFQEILSNFNSNDTVSEDLYVLNKAYNKQEEIKSLLNELRKNDFTNGIFNKVMKYFPIDFIPPRNYDVFFTIVGWHWGDAHAFRYQVKDNKYTISPEGIPAMMFNLTLTCDFHGDNTLERITHMKKTMAHELFHAIFFDSRPNRWRNTTAGPDDSTDGFGFWLND